MTFGLLRVLKSIWVLRILPVAECGPTEFQKVKIPTHRTEIASHQK